MYFVIKLDILTGGDNGITKPFWKINLTFDAAAVVAMDFFSTHMDL